MTTLRLLESAGVHSVRRNGGAGGRRPSPPPARLLLRRFAALFVLAGLFGLRLLGFLAGSVTGLSRTAAAATSFAEGFAQHSEKSLLGLLLAFHIYNPQIVGLQSLVRLWHLFALGP